MYVRARKNLSAHVTSSAGGGPYLYGVERKDAASRSERFAVFWQDAARSGAGRIHTVSTQRQRGPGTYV